MNISEETKTHQPKNQKKPCFLFMAAIAGLVASGCERKQSTDHPPQIKEAAGQETDPRVLEIAGQQLLREILRTRQDKINILTPVVMMSGKNGEARSYLTLNDENLAYVDRMADTSRGETFPVSVGNVKYIDPQGGTMAFEVILQGVLHDCTLIKKDGKYIIIATPVVEAKGYIEGGDHFMRRNLSEVFSETKRVPVTLKTNLRATQNEGADLFMGSENGVLYLFGKDGTTKSEVFISDVSVPEPGWTRFQLRREGEIFDGHLYVGGFNGRLSYAVDLFPRKK